MRRSILAAAAGFAVLLAGCAVIRSAGEAEASFLEIGLLASVAGSGLAGAIAMRILGPGNGAGEEGRQKTLFMVFLESCAPATLLGAASAAVFVALPALVGPRITLISSLVRIHGPSIAWVPAFSGLAELAFALALTLLDRLRLALRRRLLWSLSASHLVAAAALAGIAAFIVIAGGEGLKLVRIVEAAGNSGEMTARVVILILWALLFYAAIATMALLAALPLSLVFSRIATGGAVRRLAALLDSVESFDPSTGAVRSPIERPDEIGRLQQGFNSMAERLEKATRELREEKDRNEALLRSRRELMARLSHDLRTPIANLSAILESEARLEAKSGEAGAGAPAWIGVVASQLDSLRSLTEDLMDAARGDAERLAVNLIPLDPSPLLKSAAASFAPLAHASGGILVACEVSELPALPPCLFLDPKLLDRAVSNLLRNALRNAGPGGIVLVRGRRAGEDYLIEVANSIALDCRAPEGREEGPLSSSGLRLGLILAREYIEAMGGEFSFSLEPEGALARIVFPLCDSSATASR